MVDVELASRLDSSAMDNSGVATAAAMDLDADAFDDTEDAAVSGDPCE